MGKRPDVSKATSTVEMVLRRGYYHGGLDVVELAAWLGINQATLHRWKDAKTFDRATGHAAELVRRLAKVLDLAVTHETVHYCRLAAKDRGNLGAFCQLAHQCYCAEIEAEKPAITRKGKKK